MLLSSQGKEFPHRVKEIHFLDVGVARKFISLMLDYKMSVCIR